MRRLIWVLAGLAVLWGGYWLAGVALIQRAADGVLGEQIAQGTLAPGATAQAGGFPLDFALAMQGLRLAEPDGSGVWEAKSLDLSLPAWAPWSAEANLTGPLNYSDPLQQLTLAGTGLEAGIAASPQPSLPLASLHLEGAELRLDSSLGWKLAAGLVQLRAERDPDDDTAYTLTGLVTGLTPDPGFATRLAAQSTLPPVLGDITLRAELGLTDAVDRSALFRAPGVSRIGLQALTASWGTVTAEASGEVTAESSGLAEGRIMIRISNWRDLLPALRAGGAVTDEFAPTAERMLAALAASSGDPAVLELPLTVAEGFMSLGPFPLGPAPLLR